MTSSKGSTIVLVHGMWHAESHWDHLIPHLGSKYNIVTAKLPSTGADPPTTSAEEDIASIREDISSAVSMGQKVTLVLHSYAGIPGTEAVQGFLQSDLKAQGHTDGRGLTHVVHVASFIPRVGDTLMSLSDDPPYWVRFEQGQAIGFVDDPIPRFYNDVNDKSLVDEAVSKLRHQSMAGAMHENTYPAHKHVPVTYVHCGGDTTVISQARMIKQIQEDDPLNFNVVFLDGCGHSPFLSRRDELAKAILDATAAA